MTRTQILDRYRDECREIFAKPFNKAFAISAAKRTITALVNDGMPSQAAVIAACAIAADAEMQGKSLAAMN